MEKTVVLYPGLSVSHFVPMMQLADMFLEEGYAVAVALIDLTLDQDAALADAVDRVASAKPSVAFHRLPRIQNPPTVTDDGEPFLWYFQILKRYNDRLREFLCSLPPRSVHAVIVDAPSVDALDVTKELGLPAYTFCAANASTLAVFLQLPWIRAEGQPSFKELGDAPVNFSGVPPIPASHLVRQMMDPESEIYTAMMNAMRRGAEDPNGILVNTFASLDCWRLGRWELSGTHSWFLLAAAEHAGRLRCTASGHWSPVQAQRQKRSTNAWRGSTGNQSAAWCCSASGA
jgi:hypothetical protein